MFLASLNKTLNPNLDKGVLQPTIILVKFVIIVGHGRVVTRTFLDGRTDGRSDDGCGGVRDLDAL
jgi:hypothetical protein